MGRSNNRTLRILIVTFLVVLLIAGLAVRSIIRKNLTESALRELETSSLVLSDLAAAYYADGTMNSMQFIINLDLTSRVSDVDVLVCNEEGRIILCSDSPTGCEHQGYRLTEEYRSRILSTGGCNDTSAMENLYDNVRYITARPVYAENGGELAAIVIVSMPVAHNMEVLRNITHVYLICVVVLLAAGWVVLIAGSRRLSLPLRQMAKTARAFGHGELDARVHLSGDYTADIEELALAFNNLASSLQKSEYSRQEFVANVSHELKTPMTTIGGYIDGILDGTIPPEKQQHYMRIVSEETKRLSRLVRSMLDIAQLQSEGGIPEDKKTRFDICECAGQSLITYEQKITSKQINVQVQMPDYSVYTVANRDYISQVIYNLLDNAVKFCPEGGTLWLSIREGDSKLFLSVANEGQTIPPAELSLLFDRFHKIDKSRTQKKDGWGLGLYIVKTIVGLHGEDISVTSLDGKTEFTFTLPLVE